MRIENGCAKLAEDGRRRVLGVEISAPGIFMQMVLMSVWVAKHSSSNY